MKEKKNNGYHLFGNQEVFLIRNATDKDKDWNPKGGKQVLIRFADGEERVVKESHVSVA